MNKKFINKKVENCFISLMKLTGEELENLLKNIPIVNLSCLASLSSKIFHDGFMDMLDDVRREEKNKHVN